jgi:hypothetical protein
LGRSNRLHGHAEQTVPPLLLYTASTIPMIQIDASRGQTHDVLKDLISLASRETIERDQARAAIAALPPARARFTRERACLVGLGLSVPILLIVLVTNVLGLSLMDLITPAPTPEVARQQAQETLEAVVTEIESFHHDYSELPDVLAEVGVPPRGAWAYLKKPDGRYQVVGQMYGQIVTFDSPPRKLELDAPHQ